ncbi:MAG: hypothetical protein IJG34_04745 [Synergistaceae bacterium]|nr:hypothetical protein [Synergistaceae bacterium]MBQ3449187.1 hypothetical protein [Synergistaceae bacterium]
MNNTIVLRFTENTISSAERIKQAAQIAKSNPAYKYAILSAPGKSSGDDIKVTDVLYMCHSQFINGEDYHEMLGRLRKTFENLLEGLGIEFDLDDEIKEIEKSLITGRNADFIASRGEYLISKIFAQLLGWEFIDAEEIIFFRPDGKLDDDKTIRVAGERLKRSEYAVIPSFYGTVMTNGKHVKTFPRGQCDTTGAVVSRAVNADYLEKWMYKTRPYSADPSIVKDPQIIRNITYNEVLELNYMGIKVFEDDVALILRDNKIPVRIRTLFYPDDEGTLVSLELPEDVSRNVAVCIAGRKNFNVVHIEKFGLNKQKDFGKKLFSIFEKYNVACEHTLSGIHKVSIVLKSPMFHLRRREIMEDLKNDLEADNVEFDRNLSLIAVIGNGMGTVHGVFEKVFSALAGANVKVHMIDQGSDEASIILGVYDEDFDSAVNALYTAMILN